MAVIKLSREAANKVIQYSTEAYEELNSNTVKLNQMVMLQFQNLKDPVASQKFMELMMQLENMLKQVGATMEEIRQYCQTVIRWIDTMQAY